MIMIAAYSVFGVFNRFCDNIIRLEFYNILCKAYRFYVINLTSSLFFKRLFSKVQSHSLTERSQC